MQQFSQSTQLTRNTKSDDFTQIFPITYGPHQIKLQDNYMKTEFVARNNETFRLKSANFQGIKANKLSALKHAGGNLSVYPAFDPSE